jgi:hypothetical protein
MSATGVGVVNYPAERPARLYVGTEPNKRRSHLAVAVAVACLTVTWAVLSPVTAIAQTMWSPHSSSAAVISFWLPVSWQVEDEPSLEKVGYLSSPFPTYAVIAGAESATLDGVPNPPYDYAFSETPSPWAVIWVESRASAAPSPVEAYQVVPGVEVAVQEAEGLGPSVLRLTRPAYVRSGGLGGSQDRTEVIVPGAGDIELDGVVYAKGQTVWMAMVGCTVTCYNANAVVLRRVIGSVKVGTAILPGAP